MNNENNLVINLNVFCTNQNKRDQTKLTINKDEITSVYQLKTKIQDLCKAPICDQKLSYLDQPLSDPTTKLSELYLRDGDIICVEFLDKVDIEEFDESIRKIKSFLSSAPPFSSDGNSIHVPLMKNVDKIEDLYADIAEPLESLDMRFSLWKTVQVKANRHYFVQERGLEVLVEVLHYSQKKYSWICSTSNPQMQVAASVVQKMGDNNDSSDDDDDEDYLDDITYRSDELVQSFNEWQMILCSLVLQTLWNFMETGPETRLVLNMGILQSMIDAYIQSDNYNGPSPHLAIHLRESALGCLCGCVEYDERAQLQVAENLVMMKKLSRTIEPRGFFQRNECCLAANTLFYVSFNQQAIERLICLGFYEEILDKVQAWHQEFDSSILVLATWYYCLLFVARVRSSTLCALPHKQSNAIDSVIERFVQEYNPRRIAEYEEKEMYVWITLAPIVHMAFSAGPRTRKTTRQTDQNDESFTAKKSRYSAEMPLTNEVDMDEFAENDLSLVSSSESGMDTASSAPQLHGQMIEVKEIELGNPKTARWPGSPSVQKLAIFALQHTLYSKDNRQLLKAEGLDSYLVCLQWQLKAGTEYDNLKKELLVVAGDEFKVPTLTVICKAVLASMHGLDSVYKS